MSNITGSVVGGESMSGALHTQTQAMTGTLLTTAQALAATLSDGGSVYTGSCLSGCIANAVNICTT